MKNTADTQTYMVKDRGWTIIELMIAVTIVGIIGAIIYPNYQDYIVRSGRTEAQTELTQIAQNLESYKMANNNSYAGATLSNDAINGSTKLKSSGVEIYDLRMTIASTGDSWTIRARPLATTRQAGDGDVALNDLGQRCWEKGTICTPSTTTSWTK
jgi:type IV pilus assembly protein PilE